MLRWKKRCSDRAGMFPPSDGSSTSCIDLAPPRSGHWLDHCVSTDRSFVISLSTNSAISKNRGGDVIPPSSDSSVSSIPPQDSPFLVMMNDRIIYVPQLVSTEARAAPKETADVTSRKLDETESSVQPAAFYFDAISSSSAKRKFGFINSRRVSSSDLSNSVPDKAPTLSKKRRTSPSSISSSCSPLPASHAPSASIPATRTQEGDYLCLLAHPDDNEHLNPLHCFVRRQIEIFVATPADIAAPSPGRKYPVKPGQVGIRCIHCRAVQSRAIVSHSTPSQGGKRRRVKRAVCYPSSVARVYHSVSDMKFDHFARCPYLPPEVRSDFERLRAETKRIAGAGEPSPCGEKKSAPGGGSQSSTARYYFDAAVSMGMVDMSGGGIFLDSTLMSAKAESEETSAVDERPEPCGVCPVFGPESSAPEPSNSEPTFGITPPPHDLIPSPLTLSRETPTVQSRMSLVALPAPPSLAVTDQSKSYQAEASSQSSSSSSSSFHGPRRVSFDQQSPFHSQPRFQPPPSPCDTASSSPSSHEQDSATFTLSSVHATAPDSFLLALPEDAEFLNPIHCFVRRNVEVFVANADDIAAPAPGRKKRVSIGQVGIRCIHCSHLPPRDRIKRAVCFPPSVSGIYHAVSNMKFDHFGACRGLSPKARDGFARLKASCGRRGGGSSSAPFSAATANSTAQYYQDSSARLGLVDTEQGIGLAPKSTATTAPKPTLPPPATSNWPAPTHKTERGIGHAPKTTTTTTETTTSLRPSLFPPTPSNWPVLPLPKRRKLSPDLPRGEVYRAGSMVSHLPVYSGEVECMNTPAQHAPYANLSFVNSMDVPTGLTALMIAATTRAG